MNILSIVLLVALGTISKKVAHGWTLPPATTDSPGIALGIPENRNGQLSKDLYQNQKNSMDFKQKLSENTLLGSGELSRPKRNIVDTHEADGSQNLTPQQREYYHKLLSMLASREGFGERVSTAEEDTDFIDDDDENEPIELGYYGSNPYTSDEMAERRPKTKQSRKSKVFTDTNGRYKSSPSLDNSWDEPVEIHRHSEENRSRIPARVVPVHGVYRYHVVGSNREYSPFERRVFTNPVQTLAKRNTKYFF